MSEINRKKVIHETIEENMSEEEGKEEYPSAYLLLESARDEYTKERERSQILDGKAAHFMTAIILVATVFVPIIPLNEISEVFDRSSCEIKCVVILLGLGAIVSFFFLIFAFKHLYDAYHTTLQKETNHDHYMPAYC